MDIFGPSSDPSQDPERRMSQRNIADITWSHPIAIEEDIFSTLKTAASTIPTLVGGDTMGGGLGKGGGPVFTSELIAFNGIYPKDGDTFFFPRISEDLFSVVDPDTSSCYQRLCRTDNHPYTVAVIGLLFYAQNLGIIYGVRVSTAIDAQLHTKGLELYNQLNTKKEITNVL